MDGNSFTTQLLAWYDAQGRDLPWRRNPEPYGVWISEIMAQQTQMDRVVEYWERWMKRYPNLSSLARAGEEEILKSWEGLGYYSRARNIRKAASLIMNEHDGVFPEDAKAIRSLPGIGAYTAGAIGSIAFGHAEPAIDANVLRVFARLLDVAVPVNESSAKSVIEKQVRELIPDDRAGDFNQSIMELGALVCAKSPRCPECPVRTHCLAFERDVVAERPVLPVRRETIKIDMATGVLVHEGKVLIQKRLADDIWPGLWEFPGGVVEKGETPEQALLREYREEVELDIGSREKITTVQYSYTRYRVTMHCYLCHMPNGDTPCPVFNEASEGGFVAPRALTEYAFPAGHRRLIEFMQGDLRFSSELFLD